MGLCDVLSSDSHISKTTRENQIIYYNTDFRIFHLFFHLYIKVNRVSFLKAYHLQKAARLDVKFTCTKLPPLFGLVDLALNQNKMEQSLCYTMLKRQLKKLQFCIVTHAFTSSQISGFIPRQFFFAFLSFYG